MFFSIYKQFNQNLKGFQTRTQHLCFEVSCQKMFFWYAYQNKELGSLTTKFGPISEIDEKPNRDKY